MFLTKKYLLSFLIIVSLGILQFSMVVGVKPALADSTLFNSQSLLKESAAAGYGTDTPKDAKIIAIRIINTILSFLAILTVALMFWAGFNYMTSQGNEEKIKKSMGQLTALAVGLLIILSAWGITYYLLKTTVCVTTSTVTCPANYW